MLTRILALLLFASPAFAAGPPFIRAVSSNCSSPSATCSFANLTLTGKLTLSGTTGPQIDSTGTSAFEFRSRAADGTDGAFRFYVNSSYTSNYMFKIAEKAGTTAEDRLTLDYQGTLRLYPESVGLGGGDLELFGKISQTNGGADGPVIINGGVNTTAFTGRLLSVRRPVGAVQVVSIRADGTIQQTGVATASLGACNGSAEGARQYDTTEKRYKYCDGTAWRSEIYVINVDGTQDPGSIAAQTCYQFDIGSSGVLDADVAACDRPADLPNGITADCTTATDVIGWRLCNVTAGAIDPGNGTYRARIIRP